ncbi:MAG: hypothetical protein FJY88_00650 [Candidatus Eisenbacteria bacterium]|nr:hypothetical protein [Candidatus Eisenbacteria bacterium]
MALQLNDPKSRKIILGSALGAALLYVYFMTTLVPFTYKAGASELKELSGRYEGLTQDLTKARQTINSLPYMEKEFDLLHRKWATAQQLLPDQQEMASLLRAITTIGDQAGVGFVLFRPSPPQPAQFHTEHPIEIKVEGGYHEIGTFLGEIANMERIVTVSDLSIESAKDSPLEKPAAASFVARTYTLGGTGVPPGDEDREAKGDKKAKGKGSINKKMEQAKEAGRKLKAKQRGEGSDE